MRSFVFIGLLILALFSFTLIYFDVFNLKGSGSGDGMEIPRFGGIYILSEKVEDLLPQILTYEAFKEKPPYYLTEVDSLINEIGDLDTAALGKRSYLSFARLSSRRIGGLLFLNGSLNTKDLSKDSRTFKKSEIRTSLNGNLFIADLKGSTVISKHQTLIEEFLQSHSDKNFIDLEIKNDTYEAINCVVDFEKFEELINTGMNNIDILNQPLLSSMADLVACKLTFNKNEITVNGSAILSSDQLARLKLSSSPESLGQEFTGLPSSYSFLHQKAIHVEDDYFNTWFTGIVYAGLMETYDNNFDDRAFLILGCSDQKAAEQKLFDMNIDQGDLEIETQNFNDNLINRINDPSIINNIFKHPVASFKSAYYTVTDDKVLMAQDLQVLKTLINSKEIELTTNYNTKISTYRSSHLMKKIFSKFESNYMNLIEFNGSLLNNNLDIRLSLRKEEEKNNIINIDYWSAILEDKIISGPFVVIDHNSKDYEFLIQDMSNKIYLIDNDGSTIWSKTIDGKIMGGVTQVDFYKNKKLQFLINTSSTMYLIDRKGNDVGGYPLKLAQEASNGLLFAEYGGGKRRIFIGSKQGNVYGYDISGRPLDGWSPFKAGVEFSFPLKHGVSGGKDYIYGTSVSGSLFAYSRKGEKRFDEVKSFVPFDQAYILVERNGKDVFINGNDGISHLVSTTGSKSLNKVIDLTGSSNSFFIQKKGGDLKKEIFFDGKSFIVFDVNHGRSNGPVFDETHSIKAQSINGTYYYHLKNEIDGSVMILDKDLNSLYENNEGVIESTWIANMPYKDKLAALLLDEGKISITVLE